MAASGEPSRHPVPPCGAPRETKTGSNRLKSGMGGNRNCRGLCRLFRFSTFGEPRGNRRGPERPKAPISPRSPSREAALPGGRRQPPAPSGPPAGALSMPRERKRPLRIPKPRRSNRSDPPAAAPCPEVRPPGPLRCGIDFRSCAAGKAAPCQQTASHPGCVPLRPVAAVRAAECDRAVRTYLRASSSFRPRQNQTPAAGSAALFQGRSANSSAPESPL